MRAPWLGAGSEGAWPGLWSMFLVRLSPGKPPLLRSSRPREDPRSEPLWGDRNPDESPMTKIFTQIWGMGAIRAEKTIPFCCSSKTLEKQISGKQFEVFHRVFILNKSLLICFSKIFSKFGLKAKKEFLSPCPGAHSR